MTVSARGQAEPRMMGSKSGRQICYFGCRPLDGTLLKPLLRSYHASLTRFTRPAACLTRLAQGSWDVLIVDLVGRKTEALKLIAQACARSPRIATVALVARGDLRGAVAAMKAGACECLEKPVPADLLREAIRVQLDRIAAPVAGDILTAREGQVYQRVLAGKTSGEIAAELGCSKRTVEAHRESIMHKLHAPRMVDLFRQVFPP